MTRRLPPVTSVVACRFVSLPSGPKICATTGLFSVGNANCSSPVDWAYATKLRASHATNRDTVSLKKKDNGESGLCKLVLVAVVVTGGDADGVGDGDGTADALCTDAGVEVGRAFRSKSKVGAWFALKSLF